MREQLIKYVELLFAGTPDSGDMQQEILQNTLDRYDDLIAQGKTPEAAYRLAISGIGDINEILGTHPSSAAIPVTEVPIEPNKPALKEAPLWKKILRAAAIFLYIISAIPLFVLSEMGMATIGLCGTIAIAGVATVLIVLSSGGSAEEKAEKSDSQTSSPQTELRKAVKNVITTVGLVVYFVISFATGAWHLTWLIFPIMAAVQGIVTAGMDLKEANKHER